MLYLPNGDPCDDFPVLESALTDPNGLIAIGGDLSTQRLLRAYSRGIFPWYEAGQPILWWSPDPRAVIVPGLVHCSKSLRKALRKSDCEFAFDRCFESVMSLCGSTRESDFEAGGTWITPEMKSAYHQLSLLGYAHSVEIYQQKQLVGGLYGIQMGDIFFGESMFSLIPNASKFALLALQQQLLNIGVQLIDCQVENEHLMSMGATLIGRQQFGTQVSQLADVHNPTDTWPTQIRGVNCLNEQ